MLAAANHWPLHNSMYLSLWKSVTVEGVILFGGESLRRSRWWGDASIRQACQQQVVPMSSLLQVPAPYSLPHYVLLLYSLLWMCHHGPPAQKLSRRLRVEHKCKECGEKCTCTGDLKQHTDVERETKWVTSCHLLYSAMAWDVLWAVMCHLLQRFLDDWELGHSGPAGRCRSSST